MEGTLGPRGNAAERRPGTPGDPGNAVLACLAAGQFGEGLRHYTDLMAPSPEDDLWGGQCLVLLGRRLEGLRLLLQARARGQEDAGALVAVAYRFEGEVERAGEVLSGLDGTRLSAFGRAVAGRERGLLLFHAGRLREALSSLQRAWETAAGDPVAGHFLGSFSAALSLVLAELGRDASAAEYASLALGRVSPPQRVPLLWARALSRVHTGDFGGAARDLDEAALGATPDAAPLLDYYRGVLADARGLWPEAGEHYRASAGAARHARQPEAEFYALLRLCALSTGQGDLDAARRMLARARHLASGDRMAAFLALRRGALLVRAHDPQALPVLEAARQGFGTLELTRELGLAHLHLAEAHLWAGEADTALAHLEQAADVRHALESGAVLAAELRGLPATLDLLRDSARGPFPPYLDVLRRDLEALEAGQPPCLTLTTLGGCGLTLAGERVRLNVGMARTVELLAFLLERGEATLEEVQTHVFEHHPPRQARDYLHVTRNALGKALPQLGVPFDRARRAYRLRPQGVRLCWDVQEVRRAVHLGGEVGLRRALGLYTGCFLPGSETAWAATLREDLEWSLARVGLETLETLQRQGDAAACVGLAQRLLQVHPLDVGITSLLVRALHTVRGSLAARQELERASQVFQRELGEVPEPLLALRRDPWLSTH